MAQQPQQPLRGVLKSMPDHPQHIRAGVRIPREGREFVVDPTLFGEAAKEAEKLIDDAKRSGAVGFESPDKPVVYHQAEPSPFNKDRVVQVSGRLIDLPGQPLIMDEVAFEYFRQAFGVHLVCEPIGGVLDPMAAAARASALDAENARLRARIAELEKPPPAPKK